MLITSFSVKFSYNFVIQKVGLILFWDNRILKSTELNLAYFLLLSRSAGNIVRPVAGGEGRGEVEGWGAAPPQHQAPAEERGGGGGR